VDHDLRDMVREFAVVSMRGYESISVCFIKGDIIPTITSSNAILYLTANEIRQLNLLPGQLKFGLLLYTDFSSPHSL
jgi:hypothetical protein